MPPTVQRQQPHGQTRKGNVTNPWPKPQKPMFPLPKQEQQFEHIPDHLGKTKVRQIAPNSIITNPTGFIASYDAVINPYNGCSFGCDYCYASNFVPTDAQKETWGAWVKVKTNATDQLGRLPAGSLNGKNIYLSTATDPYQPIEKHAEVTRHMLEALIQNHPQAQLVVQTRGTLVTRDTDLLLSLMQSGGKVQVNMTITTDDDEVRRNYEPGCPSIHARTKTIAQIQQEGIQSCITMTPLLPLGDANAFADTLLATGVTRYIVQGFHLAAKGTRKFVAQTDAKAIASTARHFQVEPGKAIAAYTANYVKDMAVLKQRLPNLGYGKAGFKPPF